MGGERERGKCSGCAARRLAAKEALEALRTGDVKRWREEILKLFQVQPLHKIEDGKL